MTLTITDDLIASDRTALASDQPREKTTDKEPVGSPPDREPGGP